MFTGSCLCGDIAFEIGGQVDIVGHCHCSMCRKFHGSAFATVGTIAREHFRWMRGADRVRAYRSSAKRCRHFCPRYGSAVPTTRAGQPFALVPMGNVAEDPENRPRLHFFTGSKAPWHDIVDDLPPASGLCAGFRRRLSCRGPSPKGAENPGRHRRKLPVWCGRVRIRWTAVADVQLPLLALPASRERRVSDRSACPPRRISLAGWPGEDHRVSNAGNTFRVRLLHCLRFTNPLGEGRAGMRSGWLPRQRSGEKAERQHLHGFARSVDRPGRATRDLAGSPSMESLVAFAANHIVIHSPSVQ